MSLFDVGVASGGSRSSSLRSRRPSGQVIVFGDQTDNNVEWDQQECGWNPKTWVSGLGVWQDATDRERKGVTQVHTDSEPLLKSGF